MSLTLIFFLISQPIVPALPEPSDLPMPTTHPIVVPLDYDTISLGMYLGKELGFELLARYDTASINGRGYLRYVDRKDYFHGFQQEGSIDVIYALNSLQLGLKSYGIGYRQASQYIHENERTYGTASLNGLVQKEKYLAGVDAGGYWSRMTDNDHWGTWIGSRFFTETPWARMLYKLSGRYDLENVSVIADAYGQRSFGSFFITPRVQARYPFGASFGCTLLALLSRITLQLDGDFRRFIPTVMDTFLTKPVTANLQDNIDPWIVRDHLVAGFGYSGVNVNIFLENGDKLFWQKGNDSVPVITTCQFFSSGIDIRLKLEHKNFSNYGGTRILFTPPGEVWEPQWELIDSLTLYNDRWGTFVTLTAGGERLVEGFQDDPYALIGLGIYYEREPLRVLLRADDLLNRRPFRWPGLSGPGRRVSLVVDLFSSRW